jgi:hypothetical protein
MRGHAISPSLIPLKRGFDESRAVRKCLWTSSLGSFDLHIWGIVVDGPSVLAFQPAFGGHQYSF